MRILLIWVPFKLEEIYGRLASSAPILPPLELAYIASYLRLKGHEITLIDAHALQLGLEDIEGIIKEHKPQMVGTTTNCPIFSMIYSVYSRSLEVMRIVKNTDPSIKTFLSGYHPTILPEEVLSETCVDYGIMGDAELPLEELCAALENNKALRGVSGIGFKENEEIVINEKRAQNKNLDFLPMPAFDLLPMDKYRFASDDPVPVKGICIRASRGCIFDCYFCPSPGFSRKVVSTHSPEYVVSMMNYLHKEYGYDRFQIHDDNFGVNRRWILKFCALLLENKAKYSWECYERFDLLNEEALVAMKRAGCRMISLGVESGSDKVLKEVKGLTKNAIEGGMRLLRKLKIKTRLFFMIGQPSVNEKDIKSTIKYAIKLNPDAFVASVSMPNPGSQFYENMKALDCIPDFRNKLIPIYDAPCDYPDFTKEYLDNMIRQAYRSFYLRPGYLIKHWRPLINPKNWHYYLKGLKFVFKK